jgi:hypothetical protein
MCLDRKRTTHTNIIVDYSFCFLAIYVKINIACLYYIITNNCSNHMGFPMFRQSKDAEVMLKLGSTEDKRAQYRLMRDAMEKRFIRVTRGALVGGVRLGMFTAAFYNIQNLLAEKRGVHDVFNVVGAGSATASAFGLISKKSYLMYTL